MATVEQATTRNGLDVDRLKETLDAIRQDPKLARFQFRLRNRWLGGGRNRSEIQGFHGAGGEDTSREEPFVVESDEPKVLLGTDRVPNPVEYVLHALAGCLATTLALHGAARGIEIESIECELEGDMDLRGFLGLSQDVSPGYQAIRAKLRVKADAPAEELAKLTKLSPVFATITQPVPIEVAVEKI